MTDIMTINYKGYTIKISLCPHDPNIFYHVWTPTGGYIGFQYTIVDDEYMPHCLGCVKEGEHKSMWLFVKEMEGTYKIFVQCSGCAAKSTENIPIRICGKERAVATIAVYLKEKADGFYCHKVGGH